MGRLAMNWASALAVAAMAAMMAVAAPANAKPASSSGLDPHWHRGVFMEIFVRAYQDSDGDGIGDLRGLISRLDYLADLGVRGLWLMPVTASADRDHGYATTDFRAIEADYGTLADFDELLRQAHARGIGVITDYVINHSAAAHPVFRAAAENPASLARDWFVWSREKPQGWDIWGKDPWTLTPNGSLFATFGPHMPDFNFRHPLVLRWHEDNLRFWLDRGIDGFRFDAAPHLVEKDAKDWNDQPESRRITRGLRDLVASYGNRHSVCEATANPLAYGAEEVCGSAFAFGFEHRVVPAAKGDAEAIRWLASYFETAPHTMATMVSNHDIFAGKRLWDQVAGDETLYRLAAATYLLLPGTPFIYYGEEVGLGGVAELGADAQLRTPMAWTDDARAAGFTSGTPFRPLSPNASRRNAAGERARRDGLFAFYKAMIALRNDHPALARGEYFAAHAAGTVMSHQRRLGDEHLLLVFNYGTAPVVADVPSPQAVTLTPLWPPRAAATNSDAAGRLRVQVPAKSFAVYAVRS